LILLLSSWPAFGGTLTVTNTNDSGPGSLRAAIDSAGSGDTIVFSLTYPAVINLTSGSITINAPVTIAGPGASNVTIDASTNSVMERAFTVGTGVIVSISGVTIAGGRGGGTSAGSVENSGGGIFNAGTLTLRDAVITNNSTRNQGPGGGGIFNAGGATLTLINCIVSGNTAGGGNVQQSALVAGGGIRNASSALLTLTDTTVFNNWAQAGGGIWNNGTLKITRSTFSQNSAGSGISTTADLEGGAIYAGSGQSTSSITNSTFFDNRAKTNGAAIANGGTTDVTHSTFAGNATDVGTGAAVAALANTLRLKANVLANAANCSFVGGFLSSGGYNLSTDATCSLTGTADLTNTPAGLDAAGLQNNGGPTGTIGLLSTSAAIDHVPTPCTDVDGGPMSTDQRGVTRPRGAGCDVGAFEAIGPEPTITSFTPSSGAAGTSVMISGSALAGATAVAFNGVNAATFTVNSDTEITAVVAVGATTGPIAVTTPDGTAISADAYTVLGGPLPTITSFSPQSGGVGASVTINGQYLSGATSVKFGGTSATFTISGNGRRVTAVVPAGAATGPIAVTTAGGTATSAGSFTVLTPPAITGFAPGSGPAGSSVTINGTNLAGASAVMFDGRIASFTVNGAGTITATVPKLKLGAVVISVTTPGGTATGGTPFTVIK
jgi:hypothetical protein